MRLVLKGKILCRYVKKKRLRPPKKENGKRFYLGRGWWGRGGGNNKQKGGDLRDAENLGEVIRAQGWSRLTT